MTLDAADMALLCKDPVSFRAAACGVTRAQYLAWTAEGMYCAIHEWRGG